jgi:hypothetical protein
MQIDLIKHGINRTFRNCVVIHIVILVTGTAQNFQVIVCPVAYRYTVCVTPGILILAR